jgi:starch synthase
MAADIARVYPGLDATKIHVVRNGIDTAEFFRDDGTDFPASVGIDVNRPSVVFVGRITRQKGLVHLLRAARDFAPGTQVVLLASSPDTPEIGAQFETAYNDLVAARRARGDGGAGVIWVKDMVPRQGVRQVLSHATVFACPSIYEPLGIVNLEAMACEAAVVASAVGGIPEVVAAGVTGSLVAYDPDQGDDPGYQADFESRFAAAVNALIADPAKCQAFGRAGRQRCVDDFSWETIARQTVDVYQAAILRHHQQ